MEKEEEVREEETEKKRRLEGNKNIKPLV